MSLNLDSVTKPSLNMPSTNPEINDAHQTTIQGMASKPEMSKTFQLFAELDVPSWRDFISTTCAMHVQFGNCKDGKVDTSKKTLAQFDDDVQGTGFPPG